MMIPYVPGLRRMWMAHLRQRDTWELPSGKIKPGEEPARAAERERLEEAGAHVEKLHRVGILITRLGRCWVRGTSIGGGDRLSRPAMVLGDGWRSRLLN